MPRPRSLTTRQIATAAITVIDRDGLAALSMRTVAAELDRRTMALYRYVEDREELECLVVELALGTVLDRPRTAPAPDPAPPRERLIALMELMREAVGAHPGVLPLAVRHHTGCLPALRWAEHVLEALGRAGLDGPGRRRALQALTSYLIGALELEHQGLAPGGAAGHAALAAPDAFPLLTSSLAEQQQADPGAEFLAGAEAVLRGLGIT
ncbi:TetR/AcrR family transcriptional regulator [Kitasatospora sp. NBC_01539]|uniref:TetR/AcrR family transcriptional regulator n=1 Tax=Kitasatospora sp. NBC_01539 TaxID=2903577 RepID=UPI0038601A43